MLIPLAVACAATGATIGLRPPDPVLDGPDAPSVRLLPGRVAAPPAARPMPFWDAVATFDLTAAGAAAHTVPERLLVHALQMLLDGNLQGAEVLFRSLLGADDRLVRGRSRIALTIALQEEEKWPELAQLPPLDPLPGDTLVMIDRAAVEAWAGSLRGAIPAAVTAPSAPETLPLLQSALGTPVVRVRVNGRARTFWLDTGASMSVIATDVAAQDGVQPRGGDTLEIAAAAGRIAARPAVVDELDLGSVRARHVPVALLAPDVLRLEQLTQNGAPVTVQIDGILGFDILRHLDFTIDLAAGTLTVARPSRRSTRPRSLLWVGYPAVRLLTRDGQPVLFGIDTGADSTIVTSAWLAKTPDPALAPTRARLDALGHAAATDLRVVQHVILSDGEYALRIRNAPLIPERQQAFVHFDGVLGANILAAAALRLDLTNGIFELRPPDVPAERDTGFVRVRH